MRRRRRAAIGSATALAAWVLPLGAAAAAGVGDCRRIPVYTAACFDWPKPHPGCAPISYAAQPCFSVRGKLTVWNGTPTFRLRPRGSKRLLGVLGGDGDASSPSVLTPGLHAAMTPAAPGELRPVTGVFQVCPLASERAGWMRPVCIAGATQLAPAPDAR